MRTALGTGLPESRDYESMINDFTNCAKSDFSSSFLVWDFSEKLEDADREV